VDEEFVFAYSSKAAGAPVSDTVVAVRKVRFLMNLLLA
jgi:hypothetical protein